VGRRIIIHGLHHTGNQFSANPGANTRELMVRMGHDSQRAALNYLHSSDKREPALADLARGRDDLPKS
jgi:hypothetical protein